MTGAQTCSEPLFSMQVRPLSIDDLAQVTKIESQSPSPWDETSLSQELLRPTGKQFVYIQNNEIVAWAALQIIVPEAELLKIAVDKESRRQGIAAHFFEYLHCELIGEGVEDVFLEVRSANIAALNLYQKLGFIQIAERKNYYENPSDNALIFKLDLVYSNNE